MAQAGRVEALGKEGPRGQRRGRSENGGGAEDRSESRRWGPGHLGSGRAGRKGGAKDLLGFKVPDAKKWRAKFPRAGGTWGAKTPLGGDLVLPPEQRAGMGS